VPTADSRANRGGVSQRLHAARIPFQQIIASLQGGVLSTSGASSLALPVTSTPTASTSSASLVIQTETVGPSSIGGLKTLPQWNYALTAPRDGFRHAGVIVGSDPVNHPGISRIPTYIVP
jgi:hypothetical protein